MLVSVLMTCFNSSKHLKDAVFSVLEQEYENIELLIYDDCSKDDTRHILKEYSHDKRVKIYFGEENKGLVFGRNYLLDKASGELITLVDSDDKIESTKISLQVNLIRAGHDIVGTNAQLISDSGKYLDQTRYSESPKIQQCIEASRDFFIGSSIMFKKHLIEDSGDYSDHFDRIGSEDVDLVYRMILKGAKFTNLELPLYYYRMTLGSLSRNSVDKNKMRFVSNELASKLYFLRKSGVQITDSIVKKEKNILLSDELHINEVIAINQFSLSLLTNDKRYIIKCYIKLMGNTNNIYLKFRFSSEMFTVVSLGYKNYSLFKSSLRKILS